MKITMSIVLAYIHEVISTALNLNICKRKPFKVNLIDMLNCKLTLAILPYLDHALFTPPGVNNAQLLGDSKPMKLLETPRSLSEYTPILLGIIEFSCA